MFYLEESLGALSDYQGTFWVPSSGGLPGGPGVALVALGHVRAEGNRRIPRIGNSSISTLRPSRLGALPRSLCRITPKGDLWPSMRRYNPLSPKAAGANHQPANDTQGGSANWPDAAPETGQRSVESESRFLMRGNATFRFWPFTIADVSSPTARAAVRTAGKCLQARRRLVHLFPL